MTTWNNRGNVFGANSAAGVACNNSGLSLALDTGNNVYKSTDGGVSWILIATVDLSHGAIGSGQGNLVWDAGSNRWVWGAEGDLIAYSDNDGLTWTTVNTGTASGGTGWVVTNGSGDWVVVSNIIGLITNLNRAKSSNNVVTWTNSQYVAATGIFATVWNGTEFVTAGVNDTVTNGVVITSPDGAVWTTTSGPNKLNSLDYDGSLYISSIGGGGSGIAKSTVAANLLTVSPVIISGITASLVVHLNGLWFVFDTDAGTVATSTDGSTWSNESTGAVTGDSVGFMAYDSTHNTWIVTTYGSTGGGYVLTRAGTGVAVPNVVGMLTAIAESAISGAGLTTGAVTTAYSDAISAGHVISSNPIAGVFVSIGSSVSLLVSMGSQPRILSRLTQKLLLYLHRVFDKDPHLQLAFRLQYNGGLVWSVADGVFTTTVTGGSGSSFSLDLASFTIASLCDFFASMPGYSVPYRDTSAFGLLNARVLFDHVENNISISNGDHVYGYTTLLWAWMDSNSSELGAAKSQIGNALLQMNTTTAQDEWLDYHGSFYKVPRLQNELDPNYSPRIIASVLQPRGNNVAIAVAIQAIAIGSQTVRVIDAINNTSFAITYDGLIHFDGSEFYDAGLGVNGAYGFFDVDFSFDFSGSVTQATYFDQITTTVEAFRDGGTQLRAVIFRNNGSTATIVSDTFVGTIRVIVYDDFTGNSFRLLENGLVRFTETGDARILES